MTSHANVGGLDGKRVSSVGGTCIAVFAILAFSVNVAFRFVAPDLQVFAASSLSKKVLLPALYCAAVIVILTKHRSQRVLWQPPPIPLRLFVTVAFLSTTAALFSSRQEFVPVDLVQGLALFGGFAALQRLGSLLALDSVRSHRRLLNLLIAVGLGAAFLGISTNPLSALSVPAAALLLYRARTERGQGRSLRGACLTGAALASLAGYFLHSGPAQPMSTAVAAQIVACLGVVALCLMSPGLRILSLLAGAIAIAWFVSQSAVMHIFIGGYDFNDVTIAQRGYETAVVIDLLNRSPVSQIFGLGPSGTVALDRSPDARTLLSSGRDLTAVDDVHLISSYLLLKLGIVGVLWLTVFCLGYVALAWRIINEHPPSSETVGFLLFLTAGLANSITAATNLFTNPLVGLFLGLTSAMVWRSRQGASDQGTGHGVDDSFDLGGRHLGEGRQVESA